MRRALNWIGRILSNSAVLYAWHLAKVKRIEMSHPGAHRLDLGRGLAPQLDRAQQCRGHPAQDHHRLSGLERQPAGDDQGRGRCAEPALAGAQGRGRAAPARPADQSAVADRGRQAPGARACSEYDRPCQDERGQRRCSRCSPRRRPSGARSRRRRAYRPSAWRCCARRSAATIKDPALLEEANRLKLELDPLDGAALQTAIVRHLGRTEVVARARRVAER